MMGKRLVVFATVIVACGQAGNAAQDERPVILPPDAGDVLWFNHDDPSELGSGGELRIYVDSETHPHATSSFAKFTLGPGGQLPTHRHDKTEEFAYFLSGEGVAVAVNADGSEEEIAVREGYIWYNPPSVWHAIRNTGPEPLVLVFATVPNEKQGLLSFFRRIGVEPGKEATVIPTEEFARIAAEHDLILRPMEES